MAAQVFSPVGSNANGEGLLKKSARNAKTSFPVGADLCVHLIDRAEAQALALKTNPPYPPLSGG